MALGCPALPTALLPTAPLPAALLVSGSVLPTPRPETREGEAEAEENDGFSGPIPSVISSPHKE